MPLLFATIGNPSISFPKMAAMDDEGRTASSLEHKFRKWRQQGREIADKHPEHAAAAPTNATKKTRAPAVKKEASGKGKGKQAGVGDEEDEVDEEAGATVVKQELTETVRQTSIDTSKGTDACQGAEGEISPKTVKGNAKAKKATPTNGNAVNGSKKRGSEDATADADNEGTPAKKPKVTKKGTAKVQKKAVVKAREEKVTDEEGGSEEEKVAKPKPKSRTKAAPKSKSVAQKDQEPEVPAVEDTVGENHFEEAFDPELVGGQEDGMTEMKFEEEV